MPHLSHDIDHVGFQAEVTELAGAKGRHDGGRTHTRHGTEHGSVTLGGRRLPVTRPRVRTVGDEPEEATLHSYATFADTDLLTEQVTARMLARISTRTYPVALEPVGEHVEAQATAAVCPRLVADLVDRGLDVSNGVLFIIDGGKALAKAIR